MPSIAPAPTPVFSTPRFKAYVNGQYVESNKITVTQTAYSVADTVTLDTSLWDQNIDWGALTQKFAEKNPPQTVPFTIRVAQETQGHVVAENQLFFGFLDDLVAIHEEDILTFSARGILSLMADQRITARADMNVSVDKAIAQLITKYVPGVTVKVDSHLPDGSLPPTVGKVLQADFVSTARNMMLLEYVEALAVYCGWKIRAQNSTVYVGAQSTNPFVFKMNWKSNAGMKCRVTHAALHAHDVKVKVISYIPKQKAKTIANSQPSAADLAYYSLIGVTPLPSPAAKPRSSGGRRLTGSSSVGAVSVNNEEYIEHIPGLTPEQCLSIANALRDEISAHEFVMELEWSPTGDDLTKWVQNAPNVAIVMSGLAMASMNGVYYPRKLDWTYDVGSGAYSLLATCVNHPIPVPQGNV